MRKLPAQRVHFIHPPICCTGTAALEQQGNSRNRMGEHPSPYPSTTAFSKTLSTALIGPWSRRPLLWTWPYSGKVKSKRCKITTLTMTLSDYGFKAAPLALQSLFSQGSILCTQKCLKSWHDREVCFFNKLSYLNCFVIGTTSFYTVSFTKKH